MKKRRFYQHREIKFHLLLVLKSTLIAVNRPCSRAFHGRTRFSLITILRISGKFHYFSGGERVQCCDSVDVCHTVSNAQTKTDCVATRQNRPEREHRPKSRINAGLFFCFARANSSSTYPENQSSGYEHRAVSTGRSWSVALNELLTKFG